MVFEPKYGKTLASEEDHGALTPRARELLEEPFLKAEIYNLEQRIQTDVTDDLAASIFSGEFTVSDLLQDHFLREVHGRLYGPVWEWGGCQRAREANIGVAPERITEDLRNTLDDFRYRWESGSGMTPRALGLCAHAALVHIHPFVDGNGRVTRLLADLLYLAAQGDEPLLVYNWDFDRAAYIRILQHYDNTHDATELIEFVSVMEVVD